MAAHEIELRIIDGKIVDRVVYCKEVSDAACHTRWICNCEDFYDFKMIDGKPTHSEEPDGPDKDRCIGVIDAGYCVIQAIYADMPGEESGSVFAELIWDQDGERFEIDDL